MKRLLLILSVVLTGCASTITPPPSQLKFPAVPAELKQACPDLELVGDDVKELSGVLNVVTDNYAQYKICKERVDAWVLWYNQHQQIWDNR
jgi:PBP1b-binding outer membrane lipoprotein LpoB